MRVIQRNENGAVGNGNGGNVHGRQNERNISGGSGMGHDPPVSAAAMTRRAPSQNATRESDALVVVRATPITQNGERSAPERHNANGNARDEEADGGGGNGHRATTERDRENATSSRVAAEILPQLLRVLDQQQHMIGFLQDQMTTMQKELEDRHVKYKDHVERMQEKQKVMENEVSEMKVNTSTHAKQLFLHNEYLKYVHTNMDRLQNSIQNVVDSHQQEQEQEQEQGEGEQQEQCVAANAQRENPLHTEPVTATTGQGQNAGLPLPLYESDHSLYTFNLLRERAEAQNAHREFMLRQSRQRRDQASDDAAATPSRSGMPIMTYHFNANVARQQVQQQQQQQQQQCSREDDALQFMKREIVHEAIRAASEDQVMIVASRLKLVQPDDRIINIESLRKQITLSVDKLVQASQPLPFNVPAVEDPLMIETVFMQLREQQKQLTAAEAAPTGATAQAAAMTTPTAAVVANATTTTATRMEEEDDDMPLAARRKQMASQSPIQPMAVDKMNKTPASARVVSSPQLSFQQQAEKVRERHLREQQRLRQIAASHNRNVIAQPQSTAPLPPVGDIVQQQKDHFINEQRRLQKLQHREEYYAKMMNNSRKSGGGGGSSRKQPSSAVQRGPAVVVQNVSGPVEQQAARRDHPRNRITATLQPSAQDGR